ncbi:FAD/NAD(P)-binding protein [Kitasatospora sp. NPDC090308]|uniref:FAD/NAD(P)-binding protein n=1 Tax=Kitasatospora sp. NPDC090308 TaxID=3364082 RepID=UPI003828DD5F
MKDRATTNSTGTAPHRIALIGSGPRGLSIVERLAARLAGGPAHRPVEIHLIDAVEVGTGRIWRTDQPDWFLMNTVADEVSSFSGPPDDGPARPGAGPSLAQWWAEHRPDHPGPNSYAPRRLHGEYMQFVLRTVEENLPPHATLHRVRGEVTDLERLADDYRLTFADGTELRADRVVLTTGHTRPELSGLQKRLADFAAEHPALRYIRGDSAADMPLDEIPAGSPVGVLGLGLSFYDVMAALTEGRGGTFVESGARGLRYEPSGAEPLIVAGSRSGLPLLARGRNQKHHDHRYTTRLFTLDRVRAACAGERVDFAAHAVPWLIAEVHLVQYATVLRERGAGGEDAFVADVLRAAETGVPDVAAIAARHGITGLPPIDLDEVARPFHRRSYPGTREFEADLLAAVGRDLDHAEQGNVGSPVKAALDVLRDTRSIVRALVDFSGLTPRSHRTDFLEWFVPRVSFLAAGPPLRRLRQVVALVEAGVLRVPGPDTRFETRPDTGRFAVRSPQVPGSETAVDTVIDARVPVPDLRSDPAELTRRLVERGTLTSYLNGLDDEVFDTGGVAVTRSPFHPVGRDGRPDPGLYVLGIPTEHTRWFMQGGSSRPGFWTDFVQDADAIAGDALRPATEPAAAEQAHAEQAHAEQAAEPSAAEPAAEPAPAGDTSVRESAVPAGAGSR